MLECTGYPLDYGANLHNSFVNDLSMFKDGKILVSLEYKITH